MAGRKDKYCIVGLGVTEVGDCDGKSTLMLEAEAARLALEDAGLEAKQIKAAIQMKSDVGGGVRARQDDAFVRVLGMPVNLYQENVGRGGELVASAIVFAQQLIQLGVADYVLCSGGRDDWSRSRMRKKLGIRGAPFTPKEGSWAACFGGDAGLACGADASKGQLSSSDS